MSCLLRVGERITDKVWGYALTSPSMAFSWLDKKTFTLSFPTFARAEVYELFDYEADKLGPHVREYTIRLRNGLDKAIEFKACKLLGIAFAEPYTPTVFTMSFVSEPKRATVEGMGSEFFKAFPGVAEYQKKMMNDICYGSHADSIQITHHYGSNPFESLAEKHWNQFHKATAVTVKVESKEKRRARLESEYFKYAFGGR